jgi:hypothetical protein
MSLSSARKRAYLCGAMTGAFAAIAVVDRRRTGALAALTSCCCGTLAVAFEERAQDDANT